MTVWRYLRVARVVPEAKAVLETAGMAKLKYLTIVGRIYPEEQVEMAKHLVRHHQKIIAGPGFTMKR